MSRSNPRINRQRGKATERATAKTLNGKRTGTMGGEDITHPLFSIECKSREKMVVFRWMGQCIKNCKGEKIPLLVLHQHGANHDDDLVALNIINFKRLIER